MFHTSFAVPAMPSSIVMGMPDKVFELAHSATMLITTEHLKQISILAGLEAEELAQLQPHAAVKSYRRGEIVLHEGDRLPAKLFAVLSGTIQIKRTASTGKETILRMLSAGEPFAAPALFGDDISPATVVADQDCQILTIERMSYGAESQHLIRSTCDNLVCSDSSGLDCCLAQYRSTASTKATASRLVNLWSLRIKFSPLILHT